MRLEIIFGVARYPEKIHLRSRELPVKLMPKYLNYNEMRKIIYLICLLIFTSCAKLPIQTLTLTDAISNEGKRMHELNLILLNKMFSDKSEKIDSFIKIDYTPKYLQNFITHIPEGTDFKKEFSNMIQSIIPQINSRRDKMQSALETQRIKLVTKLNDDYRLYEEGSIKLRALIESGIKVNQERNKVFEQVKGLTQNKIDLNQIETELDKFILKSGDVAGNINELNSTINQLLNK